jgi:hypothetical protein
MQPRVLALNFCNAIDLRDTTPPENSQPVLATCGAGAPMKNWWLFLFY